MAIFRSKMDWKVGCGGLDLFRWFMSNTTQGHIQNGVYYIIQSGWYPQAGCNLGPNQNSQLDFAAVFDKILGAQR